MVKGDMHGERGVCGKGGHAWQGALAWCREGDCAWQEVCMAGEMATAADGTHPTGMHFCFPCSSIKFINLRPNSKI